MSIITSKDSGCFFESGDVGGAQYLKDVAKREKILSVAQKNILGLAELPLDTWLIKPVTFDEAVRLGENIIPAGYSNVALNLYEGREFIQLASRDSAFEAELTKGYQASQLWDDRPIKYSEEPKDSTRTVEALLDPEDRSLVNPLQLETLSFPVDNKEAKTRFDAAYSYLYPRTLVGLMRGGVVPSMPPMTSTLMKAALAGDHMDGELVGAGSFGGVYCARVGNKDYAIKKWKANCSEEIIKQEIIANLYVAQDPTKPIVQVAAISDNSLVMEYIDGAKDCSAFFKPRGAHPTDIQMEKVLRAILNGLKHLESRGFCHKDIKFENCIVTTSDEVKLADFGFAQRIGTLPTRLQGTKGYVAPETYNGVENSIKADVYALGVCIADYLKYRSPKRYDIRVEWVSIMLSCLYKNPINRLSLDAIKEKLDRIKTML